MKKQTLTIVLLCIQMLSAQKIHVQTGVNLSTLNVYYYNRIRTKTESIFNNAAFGYHFGLGVELFDQKKISFPITIELNNLGGTIDDTYYRNYLLYVLYYKENLNFTMLSLFPSIKYKFIQNDHFNLFGLAGIRMNHLIYVNNFNNSTYYSDVFMNSAEFFNFNSGIGAGIELKVSNKIGIQFKSTYNFPITQINPANANEITKPNITIEYQNEYYEIRDNYYFQFQTGITYQLK